MNNESKTDNESKTLTHGIMFRADDQMVEMIPSDGRIRSAWLRKAVEVFAKLLDLPKEKQQKVLDLLEYTTMNIYDRVVITPKELGNVDSNVDTKKLTDYEEILLLLGIYSHLSIKPFVRKGLLM